MSSELKSLLIGQPKSAFDYQWMRAVGKRIDALTRMRIIPAQYSSVRMSEGNTILNIGLQNSGTAISTFVLVSDGGDWYNCYSFDGLTPGTSIVKVAKHQDIRCLQPTGTPAGGAWAQKTIRGVTYTYTYNEVAGTTDDGVDVVEYTRDVSGSDGSSETDYITPCLNVGDIICAFQTSFAGPASLIDVTWQALADGRAWAAK
ncbi:MAG: hypothetical protein KGL39_21730 [Patescibacteria group bacterium]|nr:hypothetical protein [Patescibacteria group bacterium]